MNQENLESFGGLGLDSISHKKLSKLEKEKKVTQKSGKRTIDQIDEREFEVPQAQSKKLPPVISPISQSGFMEDVVIKKSKLELEKEKFLKRNQEPDAEKMQELKKHGKGVFVKVDVNVTPRKGL